MALEELAFPSFLPPGYPHPPHTLAVAVFAAGLQAVVGPRHLRGVLAAPVGCLRPRLLCRGAGGPTSGSCWTMPREKFGGIIGEIEFSKLDGKKYDNYNHDFKIIYCWEKPVGEKNSHTVTAKYFVGH